MLVAYIIVLTMIYLLTGDIGGTNSRMSLYATDCACDEDKPLVVEIYKNEEHLTEKFDDPNTFPTKVIVPFLELCWKKISNLVPISDCEIIACLAIAGVVTHNRVNLTNLENLVIDGTHIAKCRNNAYLARVTTCKIINDFVAQGYGCLTLHASEVQHLYGPKIAPSQLTSGPKVCVGAGTGLGECYLTQTNNQGLYTCFPSEGGHVEYAPRNDVELSLWKYLEGKFASKGRISVERVVSGTGLANVYEYLAHTFPERRVPAVHEKFLHAKAEKGKVVGQNADTDDLCRDAMSILMSAYGCEVGSAAIKFLPMGGLFVTGGLTPPNMKYIEGLNSAFMISYLNKGRVSTALEKIPLYAVKGEDLGVRGAHKAAKMEYEARMGRSSTPEEPAAPKYAWTSMVLVAAAASFATGWLLASRAQLHRR